MQGKYLRHIQKSACLCAHTYLEGGFQQSKLNNVPNERSCTRRGLVVLGAGMLESNRYGGGKEKSQGLMGFRGLTES